MGEFQLANLSEIEGNKCPSVDKDEAESVWKKYLFSRGFGFIIEPISSDVLTDDSSDEEVPANYLLEFS
ncbi:hypothetical protein TNCV_2923651 [Trichonephila clavipes]|nr:hypothetical protein TNCV_2923651 [Trichonephila clavipes]